MFFTVLLHYKYYIMLLYYFFLQFIIYIFVMFQSVNPYLEGERLPVAAKKGIHIGN